MQDLFYKYNLVLPDIDADLIRGEAVSSYGRLKYHSIKDQDFIKTLPKVSGITPQNIFLAEISGSGFLQPHRDHGPRCCLNYYFEPSQSITAFYKELPGVTPNTFPGKASANLYDLNQVQKVAAFSARPGDCYLLNVSEIHSVYAPFHGTRRFITWQWVNASYSDILKSLVTM